MKERQTKKNEKINRGVINDSDDLFSGGLWWKESEQCRNGYICSTWDGVTYTNTSLGMCLTLPDGWQIGTQEQIDAVESAGQQVTGNTDNLIFNIPSDTAGLFPAVSEDYYHCLHL